LKLLPFAASALMARPLSLPLLVSLLLLLIPPVPILLLGLLGRLRLLALLGWSIYWRGFGLLLWGRGALLLLILIAFFLIWHSLLGLV
jgi:hypothetical protein